MQAAASWTRENITGNNFLYNAGSELNKTSGWYETFFRGYDAALGRFMQVDPLATMAASKSTFHYAGNYPVNSNDPMGDTERPTPDERTPMWETTGVGLMDPYSFRENMVMNSWTNSIRGAGMNLLMMSSSQFSHYYNVANPMTAEGRQEAGQLIGQENQERDPYYLVFDAAGATKVYLDYNAILKDFQAGPMETSYFASYRNGVGSDYQTLAQGVTPGWHFEISELAEGTLGTTNYSLSLKNGVGFNIRHNAKVLGNIGHSRTLGPTKHRNLINNGGAFTKYVNEYGVSYIGSVNYKRTFDKANGAGYDGPLEDTREFTIGALGAVGLTLAFDVDRNGSWSPKYFYGGLDGGLSAAIFIGGSLDLRIGGMYVFGK